jgi:hypothetical protein
MAIDIISTNPFTIRGTTNLPDGTEVGGELSGQPPDCTPVCGLQFNFTTVKNGSFTASVGGPLKAALYTVTFGTAGTPSGGKRVSAVLGESGEHLRGPYVATVEPGGIYVPAKLEELRPLTDYERIFGYVIEYTQRIRIDADGTTRRVACPGYTFEDTRHGKASGVGCDQ